MGRETVPLTSISFHIFPPALKCVVPLWAVSTFVFEENNAVLKNMIQGTQFLADQIGKDYATLKHDQVGFICSFQVFI